MFHDDIFIALIPLYSEIGLGSLTLTLRSLHVLHPLYLPGTPTMITMVNTCSSGFDAPTRHEREDHLQPI